MPDHEKFWWRMSLLLVIVISAVAWYGCNQHRSGIYAGRVVKHEHEKESVKLRFDPALEILVLDYEPERWYVVIEANGQRSRFCMEQRDWNSVKVGDYVRFEGDRFCGVENAEKSE